MRRPSLICSISESGGGKGTSKVVGVKRGPWTAEEDEILMDYIKREGEGKWRTLPNKAGLLRCGKSCRLRWMNYLRPSLKRGNITPDEEDLILRLHRLLGNRWSLIAGRIPGRTDNEIKNYWNTHLSKKLISKGIDPTTHKPLNPIDINYNLSASINENKITTSSSSSEEEEIQLYPNDHLPSSFNENNGLNNIQDDNKNIEFSAEDVAGADSKVILRSNNCIEGLIKSDDNYDEDEDIDIHCCRDESFSLFLNSLINEDMFSNQLQEEEQEELEQPLPPQPELNLMYYDCELDDSIRSVPKSAGGDLVTQNQSMDKIEEACT